NGLDPNDELVRGAIEAKTYEWAQWDKLMEKNEFASKINLALDSMEKVDPKTGRANLERALLSTMIKTLLTKGVVRTPLNFLRQTLLERTPIGLVRAIGGAIHGHWIGLENLTDQEANSIMRLMKVGAVGTAMFAWGALDATRDPRNRIF